MSRASTIRSARRAAALGAVTAALALPLTTAHAADGQGWSAEVILRGIPTKIAQSSFSAGLDGDLKNSTDSAVTVTLPSTVITPLGDLAEAKAAQRIDLAGFAQGSQGMAWKISGAQAQGHYTGLSTKLIRLDGGTDCTKATPDSAGTLLWSGTGMPTGEVAVETEIAATSYSTSTAPANQYVCAIFERTDAGWGRDYTSTAKATATADGEEIESNEASWSAIVLPNADQISGTASLTFTARTYLAGGGPA